MKNTKSVPSRVLSTLNPMKSIIARGYCIALVAVIIVVIASYLTTIPGAKNSLTDQAENNMLGLSESYIKILESRVNAINDTAAYMSSDPDFYSCLVQESEISLVTAGLKRFIRDNPDYLGAAVYDKEGNFLTASDEEYAKDDAPYYVNAALSLKRPMQSDYIKVGETDCVVFAVPLIKTDVTFGCATFTVPVELFTKEIADVKLQDTKSSFAYLLSPQGYFLYHPEKDYVGKITGEESIRDLISQGNVESAVVHFNYEGEKIAGMATSKSNGWTLIIQADKGELLQPINKTVASSIVICILISLIVSILAYIAMYKFLYPIILMTKEISNISSLDFRSITEIDSLVDQKTEIGTMAKEIKRMHDNIKNVMNNLNNVTLNISSESENLIDIASNLNDCATENSAISEELASGMENTTGAAETIRVKTSMIKQRTVEIDQRSQNTIALSHEITKRAAEAKVSSEQAAATTHAMYSKVNEEARVALEKSKAVSKINDLTNTILDIAEQTELLSLNASIEAAKSGKYGRGFAVVANEISKLAEQSSNTVTSITSIVAEVIDAVNNIENCLNNTLEFIGTFIMKDYDKFHNISVTYQGDANTFEEAISQITLALESLELATDDIVEAVEGISQTIGEASDGVTSIAERSSQVVGLSSNTFTQVKVSGEMTDTLQEIMDRFKL